MARGDFLPWLGLLEPRKRRFGTPAFTFQRGTVEEVATTVRYVAAHAAELFRAVPALRKASIQCFDEEPASL